MFKRTCLLQLIIYIFQQKIKTNIPSMCRLHRPARRLLQGRLGRTPGVSERGGVSACGRGVSLQNVGKQYMTLVYTLVFK